MWRSSGRKRRYGHQRSGNLEIWLSGGLERRSGTVEWRSGNIGPNSVAGGGKIRFFCRSRISFQMPAVFTSTHRLCADGHPLRSLPIILSALFPGDDSLQSPRTDLAGASQTRPPIHITPVTRGCGPLQYFILRACEEWTKRERE